MQEYENLLGEVCVIIENEDGSISSMTKAAYLESLNDDNETE